MQTTTNAQHYDQHFFDEIEGGAFKSAHIIAPIVIDLIHPSSVADIGCGTGSWLKAFQAHQIEDIQGVDGTYVERSQLQFDPVFFKPMDLTQPESLGRTFDLALCLEVAEHLPASAAESLVRYLTELAPVVLFSAAIPGQKGTNHINEEWPWYWEKLFQHRDFVQIDAIRPRVWGRADVEWWYRQNMFLYISKKSQSEYRSLFAGQNLTHVVDHGRLQLINEGLLMQLVNSTTELAGPAELFRRFPLALWRAISRRIRRRERHDK